MANKEINVTKNLDEVNENYLDTFKYHNLKEVFTKLGVPKAFKAGKDKMDLIKEALSQISFLKASLAKSDAKEDGDKGGNDKEEVKIEKVKEIKQSDEDAKDVLLKRLANITSNLANGVESHRLILLEKKRAIEKELAKLG